VEPARLKNCLKQIFTLKPLNDYSEHVLISPPMFLTTTWLIKTTLILIFTLKMEKEKLKISLYFLF